MLTQLWFNSIINAILLIIIVSMSLFFPSVSADSLLKAEAYKAIQLR